MPQKSELILNFPTDMNQKKYINSYKPHARVYVDHLSKYIKVFVNGTITWLL